MATEPETTTFTKGPWEVVQHSHVDGELWLSVNQHANATGMKEWIAEIKYLTTDDARQWANARLIAAAPDLYAACREALDWYGPDGDHIGEPWRGLLRAALAKADGRATP